MYNEPIRNWLGWTLGVQKCGFEYFCFRIRATLHADVKTRKNRKNTAPSC